LLVGIPSSSIETDAVRALATELGMPPAAWPLLMQNLHAANAVFFGTEEAQGIRVAKVYLEFWDAVRERVRIGSREPQLLHLGMKWSDARPDHFEQARYMVHPLLGARDVLRRMAQTYGTAPVTMEIARTIVRQGYRRAPEAGFLYLEVSEAGNPRRSFDINLYKSGMLVRDVAGELRQAAAQFGIAAQEIDAQLERLGERPLGHISGGSDRKGQEFLSVYAEIQPLPDA
jgi:hypothetical protein